MSDPSVTCYSSPEQELCIVVCSGYKNWLTVGLYACYIGLFLEAGGIMTTVMDLNRSNGSKYWVNYLLLYIMNGDTSVPYVTNTLSVFDLNEMK